MDAQGRYSMFHRRKKRKTEEKKKRFPAENFIPVDALVGTTMLIETWLYKLDFSSRWYVDGNGNVTNNYLDGSYFRTSYDFNTNGFICGHEDDSSRTRMRYRI
jgi:hypothetical protein